jgi:Leucine-rich repeat (LRR) protein
MTHGWSFPHSSKPLRPFETERTPTEQEAVWRDFCSTEPGVCTRRGVVVHLDLSEPVARERLASVTHPIGISLPRGTPPDADLLAQLRALTRRTSVGLSVSAVNDLSFLAVLPELAALDVDDGPPPQLEALKQLQSLRLGSLQLEKRGQKSDACLTLDQVVAQLAGCRELRQLSIAYTPLTELGALAELTWLRALRLGCVSRPSELRHLATLERLEHLELDLASLGTADLEPLGRLRNLTRLEVAAKSVDGDLDLAPLEALTKLERVEFRAGVSFPPRNLTPCALDWPALVALNLWNWRDPGPWLERLFASQLTKLLVSSSAGASTLSFLSGFPRIEALHLSGRLERGALARVRSLPALRELSIAYVNTLGDDALAVLAGLPLTSLDASSSSVGDAGASHLATLTHLRQLHLDRTPLTDASADALGTLQHLEALFLWGTSVGDETLAALSKLPKLRELDIGRTEVTDAGLSHLEALTHLERLSLDRANVTDAGMQHLGRLTSLRFLSLRDVETITDVGFKELLNLTNLRKLIFCSFNVTEEAEAALRARLPNLTIDA